MMRIKQGKSKFYVSQRHLQDVRIALGGDKKKIFLRADYLRSIIGHVTCPLYILSRKRFPIISRFSRREVRPTNNLFARRLDQKGFITRKVSAFEMLIDTTTIVRAIMLWSVLKIDFLETLLGEKMKNRGFKSKHNLCN